MAVDAFNTTTAGGASSRAGVTGAIKQASASTGASFEYLLSTAKMESNFNPKASASTSSAKGLFQFIDQTWLGTVKEAGAQFGYGKYADAISKSSSGSYSVSDPTARQEIMKLRDDPAASSAMAGVLTQSNSFKLTGRMGRRPTDGELYMAHFMGVGGAAKLINAAQDSPNASGAGMFPNAAAANRSIFYDRSGSARSVSGVYAELNTRYAAAANSPATRTAMAAAGVTSVAAATTTGPAGTTAAATTVAAATPAANASFLSSFPDLRTAQVASLAPETSAAQQRQQAQPIFRSLYQGGDRPEPVSPAVQELWGNRSSLTSVSSLQQTPTVRTPQPLDLFSDRAGTFSS